MSQIPISEDLPMRNVLVYSYIDPEGGFDSWDVEKLTLDKSGSDALRYSFAKSFSLSRSRTELTNSLFEGGRRLVNLIDNLKRFFLERGLHIGALPDVAEDGYFDAMDTFRYSSALRDLEMGLKEVSKGIDDSRCKGDLDSKKNVLFDKYLALVRKLSPFCPSICDKVMMELDGK